MAVHLAASLSHTEHIKTIVDVRAAGNAAADVIPDRGLVWEDMFELPDRGGLVDLAMAAGYRPLQVETSSTDALDAFESGFLADNKEWLLTHADHPRAAEIRARADEHRRRWLHGYRNGFGFAYLVLGRPTG